MEEPRMTIIVPKELQQNFKTIAFLKGTTMTRILLDFMEELVDENKDIIDAANKLK